MRRWITLSVLIISLGCAAAAVQPAFSSVADAVGTLPELSVLNAQVSKVSLADQLKNPSFVGTVFAPINSGLQPLVDAVGGDLTALGSAAQLNDIFSTSVLTTKVMLEDMYDGQTLTTMNGNAVKVTIKNQNGGKVYYINSARITLANILAGQAVVHEVTPILLPASYQSLFDSMGFKDTSPVVPTAVYTNPTAPTTDPGTTTGGSTTSGSSSGSTGTATSGSTSPGSSSPAPTDNTNPTTPGTGSTGSGNTPTTTGASAGSTPNTDSGTGTGGSSTGSTSSPAPGGSTSGSTGSSATAPSTSGNSGSSGGTSTGSSSSSTTTTSGTTSSSSNKPPTTSGSTGGVSSSSSSASTSTSGTGTGTTSNTYTSGATPSSSAATSTSSNAAITTESAKVDPDYGLDISAGRQTVLATALLAVPLLVAVML